MASYTYSNKEENRFWLQLLGEGAQILYNRLTPETPGSQKAKELFSKFDALYQRANQNPSAEQLTQLNKDAYTAAREFLSFIVSILRKQVFDGTFINLKPVYLNNLISLIDEYLYLLESFISNKAPVFNPIDQDVFWLPVFYTETRLVTDGLGDFPVDFRERSQNLTSRIVLYFQTAVSLQSMYKRLGTSDFPIAAEYREGVRDELLAFAELIVDIISEVRQKRLPGTLSLIDLDFIYRMLCYYLRQLATIENSPLPNCDPGSPRLSMV